MRYSYHFKITNRQREPLPFRQWEFTVRSIINMSSIYLHIHKTVECLTWNVTDKRKDVIGSLSITLTWFKFRNSSIQNGNRHSTTQDLDGILNVESEQRNALAAVSRISVNNRVFSVNCSVHMFHLNTLDRQNLASLWNNEPSQLNGLCTEWQEECTAASFETKWPTAKVCVQKRRFCPTLSPSRP